MVAPAPQPHHVRHSVREFERSRLPADQSRAWCPACGNDRIHDVTFRTTRLARGRGGETFDVAALAEHDPHLLVRCTCGFWWEREVAHG